jgi:O-antigen/teichoic acid export membrane protein
MGNRALAGNVAAIGLSRVAALALDGLAYVVLARYLGPTPYGQYITIFAFLSLIDLAADMMTLDVSVREIAAAPNRTSMWLSAATLVRMGLACVGLMAFGVYAVSTGIAYDPATSTAAAVAALLLPVGALRMPLVAFRAHMRMHYELGIIVTVRAVNLALLFAAAAAGATLWTLFAATVVSRALLAVLAWTIVIRQFGFTPVVDLSAVRRLIKESLPMGVSGVCVAAQLKGDIMLVGAIIGAQAAGLYGVVAQLPEYLLYVPVIFTTPMLPVLSRAVAEGGMREFQRMYQAMFDTVMSIVIPIAVLGIIVPRPLVEWLFGAAYAPAAAVLPLLMLSVVCMWFSHATAIATVAARLQSHFIWIQAVCVAVFFALDAVLIPRWGITGAAVARLVAAAIAPALTYALLRQRVGVTLSMRVLRQSAVAAAAMGVGVAALSSHPPLVIGIAGMTVYAAVLWMTGSNPFASLVHEEIPT